MQPLSPTLSIVSTVYKSYAFLDDFIAQSEEALTLLGIASYEMIFVIDGSPDDSLNKLLAHAQRESRIRIVELSRNFGHHNAMKAGLSEAAGDLVLLIDCDLETPPSVLIDFHRKMKETKADVVYGYQESRKGNWFERASGDMFWVLLDRMSDVRIPRNLLTERLMTRQYVTELVRMGDKNLFYGGLFHWIGFTQIGVPVRRSLRSGKSSYGLGRRLSLALNAVTSFSITPLKLILNTGLIISAISFLFGMTIMLRKIISPETYLLGWTSIVSLMMFFFGLTITLIGFTGIYIAKMYVQVQGRPNFIVKSKYPREES